MVVPWSTAKERLHNSCQSPQPSILVLKLIKYWKAFWSCTYQNAVHFRLYSFARCEGRKREEKYWISLKSMTKVLHIRISITALQALYIALKYPASLWNNTQLFFCRKLPKLNCLLEFLLLFLLHKNFHFFKCNTIATGSLYPKLQCSQDGCHYFYCSSYTIQMHLTCLSVNTINISLSPSFSKSHHFKAFISSFPKSCYKAHNCYFTGNSGVFQVSLSTSQLAY